MYEKRIVVFLDMLGFKEKLKKPNELVEAITELKAVLRPAHHELFFCNIDFVHFSDSIVIGVKPSSLPSATVFLLRLMSKLNVLISFKGIAVRGAIVCGDYYYKDELLLSPAMAEAYVIESKFARYPRVLVSKSVLEYFKTLKTNVQSFAQFEADFEEITLVDQDGYRFLNYLTSSGSIDPYIEQRNELNIDERKEILKNHRAVILKNLSQNGNSAIKEKYIWMGNYHNRFVHEDPFMNNLNKFELFINPKQLRLNP